MINDFVVFLLAARQFEQVPIALTRSVGSGPGHQVSYRRFWENRRTPDSLPTKAHALITNLLSLIPTVSAASPDPQGINKAVWRLSSFSPENLAVSAVHTATPFMQDFLLQKPKDSTKSNPLNPQWGG